MNVRSVRQHSTGTLIGLLIAANIVVVFALVPASWLQKAFWVASPFCPQRPSHSVFIGGQQMPIEARMFGMFGGALLALTYFAARGRLNAAAMPRGRYLAVCIALFGVMAFDGIQATLFDAGIVRLYTPNLVLRLSTGLASGIGIAMILVPLTNQTLWREPELTKAVFTNWKDLVLLLALEAVLGVVTLSDWLLALMPLSLLNSLAITSRRATPP